MSAIHQDGIIWKDTEPGVWTGFVEVLGESKLARAIEVHIDDEGQQRGVEEHGEALLNTLSIFEQRPFGTFRLGDLDCVLVIVG